MLSYISYIAAITLQLSGALLLILNAFSTKRSNLVKSFAKSKILHRDNNTNKILYNKSAFCEMCKNIYLNKCAFVYIFVGYVVGIFGEIGDRKKITALVCIVITSIIILVLSHFAVNVICKYSKKVNEEITNDELLDLGIEPDSENISIKEIEDGWKKHFQGDDNA